MSTPKDPDLAKLLVQFSRLEKVVSSLMIRVARLEVDNKRLRGNVSRTADQVATVERRLPRK